MPQSMAYAELAGLPPHVGLYAAALPPVAAALFQSSPYLQTGPTALTSLLTLGALVPLVAPGTAAYVALAGLLALSVGFFRVLVGAIRLGAVAYLMSQPVLRGFTAAAAILIIASQLPGAVGIDAPQGSVLMNAWTTLTRPGEWELASFLLSAVTVALVLGSRKIHPLVPGVLLATLVGLGFSLATGYEGIRVGAIPGGLPPLTLDLPWTQAPRVVVSGLVIALVGFAEAASISRTFAARERIPWNPSLEFVGQGAANVIAAFSGGFPVGGSFGRSSVNHLSGARTSWSGVFTGLLVLLFLPVAGVLEPLPRAVLSAIVIAAVMGLVRIGPLVGFWKMSKPQALVGWVTFGLTLLLAPHVDQAILVGILLALAIHAWREMRAGVDSWSDGVTLHLVPRGVLWFGSAPYMEEVLFQRLAESPLAARLVIHLGGLGRIDMNGALVLKQIMDEGRMAGLDVEIVDVPGHAHRILRRVLSWSPEAVPETAEPFARELPEAAEAEVKAAAEEAAQAQPPPAAFDGLPRAPAPEDAADEDPAGDDER